MKFRIFLTHILSPLMLASAFLWPPTDRLSIRLFLLIAIAIALVISLFFNKTKYLCRLEIVDQKIRLEYIGAPLATRIRILGLQELENLQLSPDGFRYEAAGVLHLKTGGRWETYVIFNKKIYAAVQQAIGQAGLSSGKSRVQTA